MRSAREFLFYFAIAAGLSLSTSCFLIISELHAISVLGWIIPAIWLAAGLSVLVSQGISELSGMFPASPGIRTYLKFALGDRFSLVCVYLYLFMLILVAGAETAMFSRILDSIFPGGNHWLSISLLYLMLLFVQLFGLELPRTVQLLVTLTLITGLAAIGAAAFLLPSDAVSATATEPLLAGIEQLVLLVPTAIFLFIGFEWTPLVGIGPGAFRRKIPWAMTAGILVNALVYSLVCLGLEKHFSAADIAGSDIPHHLLTTLLSTRYGAAGTLLISLFATLTTFNAGFIAGVRLLYLLARENKAPVVCRRVNLDSGVLSGAVFVIWSAALLSSVVAVYFDLYVHFSIGCAIIICFIYASVLLAVPRMRKKGSHKRLYSTSVPMPVFYLLSLLFLLFSAGLTGSYFIAGAG
ncbi:MAG: hypothetical protein P1U67_14515 [Alcanivoracaceae bacterium]|nr:hypothetical protein [Alcanivoracaceae bacterium]